MNSSCCYSSSNSPSLRFFDLHTVRHFAVKISCLGNIIIPFAVGTRPSECKVQTLGQRRLSTKLYKSKKIQESSYSPHYISITWTFSIFSYISNSRGRTKKNLKAWAVFTAAGRSVQDLGTSHNWSWREGWGVGGEMGGPSIFWGWNMGGLQMPKDDLGGGRSLSFF